MRTAATGISIQRKNGGGSRLLSNLIHGEDFALIAITPSQLQTLPVLCTSAESQCHHIAGDAVPSPGSRSTPAWAFLSKQTQNSPSSWAIYFNTDILACRLWLGYYSFRLYLCLQRGTIHVTHILVCDGITVMTPGMA